MTKNRQYSGQKKNDKQQAIKHRKLKIEQHELTKESHKSKKDRQYNGQKKYDKQQAIKHYTEN